MQPLTNVALKVPLFYLLDSVVKNVGGPYIELFSSDIVVAFMRIFAEVNDTDKARMDFLLSTWEEGLFFHRDLLHQMRSFIGRRIVTMRQPVSTRCAAYVHYFKLLTFYSFLFSRSREEARSGEASFLPLVCETGPQEVGCIHGLCIAPLLTFIHPMYSHLDMEVQRWMEQSQQGGPRNNFQPNGRYESPRGGGLSINAPGCDGMRRFPMTDALSPLPIGSSKDHMKAFIAETVVSINMNQAQSVNNSLENWSFLSAQPENECDQRMLRIRSASLKVAKRLDGLMSTINVAPILPSLLFGK